MSQQESEDEEVLRLITMSQHIQLMSNPSVECHTHIKSHEENPNPLAVGIFNIKGDCAHQWQGTRRLISIYT